MEREIRREMGVTEISAMNFWAEKFSSNYLEEEDLQQEGYLVFIECQKKFDSSKSSFRTWYILKLKNHFLNLYNQRVRDVSFVSYTLDDLVEIKVDEETAYKIDLVVSPKQWSIEDKFYWRDLVSSVGEKLNGLALKIFRLKIHPSVRFYESMKRGNFTNTDFGRYFQISRNVIKEENLKVKMATLEVLEREKPNDGRFKS